MASDGGLFQRISPPWTNSPGMKVHRLLGHIDVLFLYHVTDHATGLGPGVSLLGSRVAYLMGPGKQFLLIDHLAHIVSFPFGAVYRHHGHGDLSFEGLAARRMVDVQG